MTHPLDVWRLALPYDAPPEATAAVSTDLLLRWAEPHRQYHTLDHLASVLSIVEEFSELAEDADAVRLAAWYHDAVYDPAGADNEEASAALAEQTLPLLGVHPDTVAEVARLVRLTRTHDPAPADRNGALLTDADLAILAAPAAAYQAYTEAVRREYHHVPDALFAAGRAAILRNLLEHEHLFHTPELRRRYEARARANLAGELRSLAA